MKQIPTLLLFIVYASSVHAQQAIPEWFTTDLENNIGRWEADNSTYKSDQEPIDSYIIEWTWGVGKTSIIGKLYGRSSGTDTGTFWEFRQYWDGEAQQAMLVQYGNSGLFGQGVLSPTEDGQMQAVQTFSLPDGRSWEEKHLSSFTDGMLTTRSFEKQGEAWVAKRSYTWHRVAKEG